MVKSEATMRVDGSWGVRKEEVAEGWGGSGLANLCRRDGGGRGREEEEKSEKRENRNGI
uniref:Uncharacterized protein n=1 Tax=Cucumis melo TaxID=3656 RepID=A0A9I9DM45_CUCME